MGTNKELQLLERLLTDLINPDNPSRLQTGISDIFVRINTQTGEVSLYGDDDELLQSLTLFSWITDEVTPRPEMIELLREAISRLEARGFWNDDLFERPFSIELVTEDFTTSEHLLFLDDEIINLSTPLLEGLSEDLEKFISDLLGDMK